MTRLKAAWRGVARRTKIAVYLLLTALLAFLFYIFIGSPTFSDEAQYRRREKAYLVGPAEILGTVRLMSNDYEKMIIADDGEGVILYVWTEDRGRFPRYYFCWREKTGPVTVLAEPALRPMVSGLDEISLTVILFDDFPEAVRAELDVTLNNYGYDGGFVKTYDLEAERENAGYFRFVLHASNPGGLGDEGIAVGLFSDMTDQWSHLSGYSVPAVVRLYGEDGELVLERSLTLRSETGELYAAREGLQ